MDPILTLALGLVAGLLIGIVLGGRRDMRRRRGRDAAVQAELVAARQRAERATGEVQAIRTKLVTAEVLAAHAAELESDLAAAYEDAERNAELATRLESEIAAMRTGRRGRHGDVGDAPRPGTGPPPAPRAAPVRVERGIRPVAVVARADVARIATAPAIVAPIEPQETIEPHDPVELAGPRLPVAAAGATSTPSHHVEPRAEGGALSVPARAVAPAGPVEGSMEPLVAATSDDERPSPIASEAARDARRPDERPGSPQVAAASLTLESLVMLEPPAPSRRRRAVRTPITDPAPTPSVTLVVEPDPEPDPVIEAAPPAPHPHGWSPIRAGLSDPYAWLGTGSPAGIPFAEDDLTRIHGVGPYLARRLREEGVLTWRQVTEWDEDDMTLVSRRIGSFPDRIRREDWPVSARALHETTYGERLP